MGRYTDPVSSLVKICTLWCLQRKTLNGKGRHKYELKQLSKNRDRALNDVTEVTFFHSAEDRILRN